MAKKKHERQEEEGLEGRSGTKKARGDNGGAIVVRAEEGEGTGRGELVLAGEKGNGEEGRLSRLQSPTMKLLGETGAILDVQFSHDGESVASGGMDTRLFLWRVAGDCENYAALRGHKNAITAVRWSYDSESLYTSSADKTMRLWDAEVGKMRRKYAGHTLHVNAVDAVRRGTKLAATGSDDGTAQLWDERSRRSVTTIMDSYQVTSVAFSDDAGQLYTAGVEGVVKAWDVRNPSEPVMTLSGHRDVVTSLALSPDGDHLLSNAMDRSLRVWDLRPYAPTDRCTRVLTGHVHGFGKELIRAGWNGTGDWVASGSGDNCVYVWNVKSRQVEYKLPGHKGVVTGAAFHPTEPILATAGHDSVIFLGELDE